MILNQLLANDQLRALEHALQSDSSVLIEELWNTPKALVAAIAQKATGKQVLMLTGASQEEVQLYNNFAFFTDAPVLDFPAWETLPSDQIAPSPDIVGDRYKALREVSTAAQPYIILTGLQACLQRVISRESFHKLYLTLRVGESFPLQKLIERLSEMGYKRQPIASDKGEFAVRGGIVDVFPVSTPEPYRIEFWGDDIDSLRTYDPIGQKSILPIQEANIPPAQELELLKKSTHTNSVIDYLGKDTLIILDDLVALEDRYANLVNIGGTPSSAFSSIEAFLDQIQPLQKIFLTQQPIEELSEVRVLDKQQGAGYYSEKASLYKLSFQMFNREWEAKRWQNPFVPIGSYLVPQASENLEISGQDILSALHKLPHADFKLHVLCATEREEAAFQEKIQHGKISIPQQTTFHINYLSSGFVLPDSHLMILPMTEVTQRFKIRRQKQRSTYHTTPSEMYDLLPGEMVVHMNNGIGRFLGIEKRPDHNGIPSEFFQIEYANESKLYVPISQAYLISKYIGANEEEPKMHTLGSSRWKTTKEKTENAILVYAKDLLELYAKRSMQPGYVYATDSPDMLEFEENFPYQETEDQLAAIEAIKKDMVSTKTMDRLVCGDVGYGKTEVAMRAAFKAVVDGKKQVAVLVPTTVLAMQHFENFCARMANFPVTIGVLSRFRSAKEIRETLEGVAKGTVDIVIGTHRIISEDVKFKDLGLIIIDEEQRFGVKAKEHLKKIQLNVDCLTLSATPIPRTLHMSLVGAREMSVINTPPQDRLPISTIVTEPNDQVLKNALLRELARDGQAFIIHNRVETIYETADHVKKLLPQARVAVGHGQMHSDEIDQVFHAFKNGQIDVLVATTIVENGIDIPNANTILIERADHFGLADLYQLRGRVGRWNRRAYAYFLVRGLHKLTDTSRKRLNALAESSGYGGGMKLAMRDLEIRGAGNILGTEQSGHVAAIGFHLYCKMLKRAVKTFQGQAPVTMYDTKIEIPIDARLPEDYINEVTLRMEFYQRFGEAVSWEEVDGIWEEIQDRFGTPPKPAEALYHLSRIRVFAARNGFTHIKVDKLTLLAEQRQGGKVLSKQIIIGKVSDPKTLESCIVEAAKRDFKIQQDS